MVSPNSNGYWRRGTTSILSSKGGWQGKQKELHGSRVSGIWAVLPPCSQGLFSHKKLISPSFTKESWKLFPLLTSAFHLSLSLFARMWQSWLYHDHSQALPPCLKWSWAPNFADAPNISRCLQHLQWHLVYGSNAPVWREEHPYSHRDSCPPCFSLITCAHPLCRGESVTPAGQALCPGVCLSSGVGGVDVFPVFTVLCNLSLLLCQENLLCHTLVYPVPAMQHSCCSLPRGVKLQCRKILDKAPKGSKITNTGGIQAS